MDLTNVQVDHNYADNGGDIDVNPDGPTTGADFDGNTIVSLSGAYISQNYTQFDGAGIRIQGPTRLLILKNALSSTMVISNNKAGVTLDGTQIQNSDRGGGLLVIGASAEISSSLVDGEGFLMVNNEASYGGGIAVVDHGSVRIFTTQPAERVTIWGNIARRTGGGIFMGSHASPKKKSR